MPHSLWNRIIIFLTIVGWLLLSCDVVQAQMYGKPAKKKKEVSLLKKGLDDLTTRNNYYFNAKTIYNEMVKNYMTGRQLNYNDTLPYYFHDTKGYQANEKALKDIIIKTGITLQRHDYSRWKDDCYNLMGRAFYLKGNIDTALITFQYVTTTMRGKFNNKKVAVSQKEILKAKQAKQKELDRLADTKKKELEKKQKEKQASTQQAIADKQKRMDAAAKQKEKDLKKKIKEKEKMLRLKAKGKYKAPANPSVSKPNPAKPAKEKKTSSSKKPGNILDKVAEGISVEIGPKGSQASAKAAEKKVAGLEAAKKRSEIGNVEDSIEQNKLDKANELTFWEKIKHHPIRPISIVWLTKSFLAKGDYQSAESMLAYSETLRKLRKKDKRELGLVESYFYYKTGFHDKAGEKLKATIPFIKKKKDKAYYNYLLAQLYESSDPSSAYNGYIAVRKNNKDEQTDFFALEQMRKLVNTGKIATPDMEELENEYKKATKSKLFGDKALFALSDLAILENDSAKAIDYLKKSIASLTGSRDQKNLSLIRLSELYYHAGKYANALECLDSAITALPTGYKEEAALKNKQQYLKKIVGHFQMIYQQDSLLMLASMNNEELAAYIKEQNKLEQKQTRKNNRKGGEDASFSATGLGNNANFDVSQDQYTAKGQWYFYNNDLKTKGFNEFKQRWGERAYANNWRRMDALQLSAIGNQVSGLDQENNQATTAVEEQKPVLTIPKTDAEKQEAHKKMENAWLNIGINFFTGLKDHTAAIFALDSQLIKYPKGELAVEAHYYKLLIYSDKNQSALVKKQSDILTTLYPESDYAKKIVKASGQIATIRKGGPNDAEKVYASLYTKFQEGKYQDVITGRKSFIENFGSEKSLLPKIHFLEAMSLAKTGNLDAYKSSLNDIIKNHPNTAEASQAKFFLNSLIKNTDDKESDQKDADTVKAESSKELFSYQDGFHYIMLIMKDKNQINAALTQSIGDLMETNFPGERIKASNSFLDAKTPLVLIKRFNNIADAEKGVLALTKSDIKALQQNDQFDMLMISQDNFKELFTSKKIDEYKAFYQKYYNGK
jgi:hypothetical protein